MEGWEGEFKKIEGHKGKRTPTAQEVGGRKAGGKRLSRSWEPSQDICTYSDGYLLPGTGYGHLVQKPRV